MLCQMHPHGVISDAWETFYGLKLSLEKYLKIYFYPELQLISAMATVGIKKLVDGALPEILPISL